MPPARRGTSSSDAPATPSESTAAATPATPAAPAAKPAARKPAARKPAAKKTAAAKSAAAKPAASKPAASKPAKKAAAKKSAAAKPAASKAASKPAAKKAASKPAAKKAAAKPKAGKADSGPMVKAARDAQAAAEERFEVVAKRLRKLNEQIIDAARDRSESTLDSYEKALKAIANGLEKGPGKSDVDWIANLATSQAKFIRDITKSMADAARDAIKK
jgi:hypothetical protein